MPTIIDEVIGETEEVHAEDYAMKLVLINGLRRKVDMCDGVKLKELYRKYSNFPES